ncbi:SPOR domain-containing protein [Mesorhizobium sp. M0898]|uniref:SPOR domain-containing protein n=1 Tax=Mesorhizobium sp. M0898 TaxID=2957020 RepID=UPI00333C9630
MADRTQLRAADHNDIANDDPFAELTRIMGFDPRQPVKPQTPAQPKTAAAEPSVDEGDFEIDLEKELMGEFGADANDNASPAKLREPTPEPAAADEMEDALAASFEQDFAFDDSAADDAAPVAATSVAADEIASAPERAFAPAVEPELDDDFDNAVAGSLEDVSPFEDDLSSDDELAASLDQDFRHDDDVTAKIAVTGEDEPRAAAEAIEPVDEPAFDDEFDNAVASSLEDEMMLEEHEPMEQTVAVETAAQAAAPAFDVEFDNAVASSLEDELMFDKHEPMEQTVAVETAAQAAAPAFDDEFDSAVASSLEDELMLHEHEPAENVAAPASPVEAVSADEDLAGHFDDAMADVDMDFDVRPNEPAEIEEPEFIEEQSIEEPEAARLSGTAAEAAFDDDFDLSFDDAPAEEAEEPVAQVAAEPAAPAAVVPTAPVAEERSLEDELNALLGAMSTRPAQAVNEPQTSPQTAQKPVMAVQQPIAPVVQKPAVAAEQPMAAVKDVANEPVHAVDELDWELDEHEPAEPQQSSAADDADLGSVLLDELEGEDFGVEAAAGPADDLDSDALDADFARNIGLDHDSADKSAAAAAEEDPLDALNWLTTRATPPEPARSWSRVTPVAQPQPAFASQPMASARSAPPPQPAATPSYRAAPVEERPSYESQTSREERPSYEDRPAYTEAAPTSRQQPSAYDEMPDVETVDVPERVVALADDLDIPELNFDDDEPVAPAYDDLDADFASLLTEMNATDIAPAPVRSAGYDDEYDAGFASGYKQDRSETRAYGAKPAEAPVSAAAASYADAADGFDLGPLPGGQPVSQADDFTFDELDYDPELDEEMSVPGLAERGAERQPRRRGLLIGAVVGAVAIAGGLGAFALTLGGKSGGDAPVIVKADNRPIKIKPENPGGTVVPNQDNKVYDAVVKGTKPAEPVQQKLVTNTEEPVDLKANEPESRVVDLSPNDPDAADDIDAPGTAASDTDGAGTNAPGTSASDSSTLGASAAGAAETAAAPAPKSEDRIAQVLQEAEKGATPEIVAVAPRKVRTMVVKPDGSLVAREDPAPAAPQMAAAEPADPAPQHVAPSAQADAAAQTGTVPLIDQITSDPKIGDQPSGDQAETSKLQPAPKPDTKAEAKPSASKQSASTPATVPVAPQRPSDQPVDVVGEVKPDQVASIDPAAAGAGSWSIQIASQPTVESAQATYQDLQRRYGSVLSGRTANIVKAEIAGKGTFYRVRVPAQSRNEAIKLCTSYKAAGGNCFVSH